MLLIRLIPAINVGNSESELTLSSIFQEMHKSLNPGFEKDISPVLWCLERSSKRSCRKWKYRNGPRIDLSFGDRFCCHETYAILPSTELRTLIWKIIKIDLLKKDFSSYTIQPYRHVSMNLITSQIPYQCMIYNFVIKNELKKGLFVFSQFSHILTWKNPELNMYLR